MEWTEIIRDAVSFIESHITEEITMYDVSGHVNVSPFSWAFTFHSAQE